MLKIDEKHLEDIIFNQMQTKQGTLALQNKGLHISAPTNFKTFRQFKLDDYGIADIIRIGFVNGYIYILIIELKVVDFALDHLTQLGRYMSAAKTIASNHLTKNSWKIEVSGAIICTGFNMNNGCQWLSPLLANVGVYTVDYNFNGVEFDQKLPSPWIKTKVDHSAYNFIDLKEMRLLYSKEMKDFSEIKNTQESNNNG